MRDAMVVSQRLEMVRRIAREIEGYVVELGSDGRLLSLQLDELMAGVEVDRELVVRDYLVEGSGRRRRSVEDALAELDALSAADLLDVSAVAKAIDGSARAPLPVPRARRRSRTAGRAAEPAGGSSAASWWCRCSSSAPT